MKSNFVAPRTSALVAAIVLSLAIASVIRMTSEGRAETARGKVGSLPPPADPTERTIADTLGSIVHVTHTHTSSNDTWLAAFDALERYGRRPPLGKLVTFVVCTDKNDPGLEKWPWLEVVEYENVENSTMELPLKYPGKVVNCVEEVMRRHRPKIVLHTMEDMIPMGRIRWELVAAGARILAATPDARFFRFGCVAGAGGDDCTRMKEVGFRRANATTARNPPDVDGMGGCGNCRQGFVSVFYCNDFAVLPMLVRPRQFVDFHKEHAARGSDSGSRMETWGHNHREEGAGLGLQGFCDGSDGGGDQRWDSHRRFAYPYIHSGVQFGMWMSAHFAEVVCPALEAQGIEEAGRMDCQTNASATPPCLCDRNTQCETEKGLRRKFFRPPNKVLPYPDGCTSWVEQGRPKPKPISPVGFAVEKALREEGLWEEPGLDEAWASL